MRPGRLWLFGVAGLGSGALLGGVFPQVEANRYYFFPPIAGFLGGDIVPFLTTWVPAFAGLLGFAALSCPPPARKMMLLAAGPGALTPLLVCALLGGWDDLLYLSRITLGAGLLLGGNHLIRRYPRRRLPCLVAGGGGLFLVLAFVAPTQIASASLLGGAAYWFLRDFRPLYVLHLLLLSYGVVGSSLLPARAYPGRRSLVLCALAVALSGGTPFLLAWDTQFARVAGWSGASEFFDEAVKISLLSVGSALVTAAAAVAVLETRLERSRTVDPAPPTA